MRALSTLLLPGGVLALAGLTILRPGVLPDSLYPYVRTYPYLVFGTGVFLGWYFNRSRVVFALLILAGADAVLHHFGGGDGGPEFGALSVLLPLNLSAYALLTERGLFTARGVTRLLLIPGQVLAVGLIFWLDEPGVAATLGYRVFEARLTAWTALPQPALVAFGATGIFLAIRCLLRPSPIAAAFFWTLVTAFAALHGIRFGWDPAHAMAAGGTVLVAALVQTAYRMAYHDDLTGLPGRRALTEALLRLGSRYAVAMVDVDHFKRFNDSYGHAVGDQVLRMVSARLNGVSGGGKAFRFGGEEFAVLFPGRSAEEAVPHLESLRGAIAASRFVLRGPGRPQKKPAAPRPRTAPRKEVSVTVSIGVAERDGQRVLPQQVIAAADKALYRAKAAGRNRVVA